MKYDERALWEAYRAGQNVTNELVQCYVPFVTSLAGSLAKRTSRELYHDMLQEGLLAMALLFPKYNLDAGVKFMSFAAARIRGAMVDLLRENDHVPRLERQREKEGLVVPRSLTSLQVLVYEQESRLVSLQEILPDERPPLLGYEDREAFDRLLRGLSERDQAILVMYFWDELTMREIAEALGLSESYISQKMSTLLDFMKKREEARHGRDGPAADGAAGRETDFSHPDGADPLLVA